MNRLRLSALALMSCTAHPAIASAPSDRVETRGVESRARALVGQMTVDEKLAMVYGALGRAHFKDDTTEQRIGAGFVPGVPRLGIPNLFESDASLGVANSMNQRKGDVATAMPSTLATAASFDLDLACAGAAVIGAEVRAKGFNVALGGGANLIRDPWAGRSFEYFSEDVLLTGRMAGATIAGVQSNHIASTLKHFALNAQETGRTVMDARLAMPALQNSDLLAFKLALDDGRPASVMCGYNRVNGDYACENAELLTKVLRDQWHYRGWVMSDWGGVHSTAKAALAGLDQESGAQLDAKPFFGPALKEAVAKGDVPLARLDAMTTRIVYGLAASGLLDHPVPIKPQTIDYAPHVAVSQAIAEAGIVLLRNRDGLLPLAAHAQRILVVGGHADLGVLTGGGSSGVHPVSGMAAELPIPGEGPLSAFLKVVYGKDAPLDAIRARAPRATVTFIDGHDPQAAAQAAAKVDVVIAFGEQWRSEAIDLTSLALMDRQDTTIAAVAKANRNTIVVLETGGAVAMPWLDQVGAVIEAWYPGEKGAQAIARVLFGDVNPSGHLPVTFPAALAQAPRSEPAGYAVAAQALAAAKARGVTDPFGLIHSTPPFEADYREGADVGYRWYQRTGAKPLFPFGFGLSYTRFTMAGLTLTSGTAPKASFAVTNVGPRAGVEVAQVYASIALNGGPALERLVGFARVALKPGETRRVEVAIEPQMLRDLDRASLITPITIAEHAGAPLLSGTLRLPQD